MASAASAAAYATVVPGAAPARRAYAKGARALRAAPRSAKPARAASGLVRAEAVAEPAPAPAGSGGVDRGSGYEVHKFGGTCVGSAERISGCCDLLIDSAKSGVKTFGIVSAMGVANKGEPKVTDCLINATDMASSRDPKYLEELVKLEHKHQTTAEALLTDQSEYDAYMASFAEELEDLKAMLKAMSIAGTSTQAFADFVVGHGELWTARLCAAAIRCKGFDAEWIDARDVLVVTDAEDGGVDVDYERSNANLDALFDARGHCVAGADRVLIATGFIARTPDGIPTTLKRNGSDYSATIFGALLIASNISIWTDVDGVYSADPRVVKEAVCLKQLSYNEAWELSYFGANVLHPRTTLPAMRYSIPVTLRNYFNQAAPGTSISDACVVSDDEGCVPSVDTSSGEVNFITGLATIEDVCLINVEGTGMVGVPGTANAVFETVKQAGCNVVMISQASSEHSICFAVRSHEADAAKRALSARFEKAIAAGRIKEISTVDDCAVLAAVGKNMCQTPGVSAMLFDALAQASVNVVAIAQGASEYNITVVVKNAESRKALNAVHSKFYLSKTVISVGVVGPGLVGKTLLRQMDEQLAELKSDYAVDLRVVGIAGNSKMLLTGDDSVNLDLATWEADYSGSAAVASDMEAFTRHVLDAGSPNAVIIDCSASEDVASLYKGWLQRGINVVTPNKKANSGDLKYYKELRNIQRNGYTHYFYEGTVGAGLPIISTVRNLLDSGDRVSKIEGIFSGTLSYIFNTFGADDRSFSTIVATAKELGYTEPDPRDDLSGMDVARKVVILARECGLDLELENVPIQSLVPEPLRDVASADEFMARLPEFDGEMTARVAEAAARGEKLRYVGVVDVKNGTGAVELRAYDAAHPFGGLAGSDNIISFETKRYVEGQALVVRGPGAGAEVTAGGVFGDVLRVCQYLGAPS
jgi:aspartokinase/homoserine dehydrogenase 1